VTAFLTHSGLTHSGLTYSGLTHSRLRARSRNRRRWTGGVLVASLWFKAFVLAVGLAQPAQAAPEGAASAEQDLLAALHVICTSGGAKVLGASDAGDADTPVNSSAAKSGLLDCARCCCSPAYATPLALCSGYLVTAAFGVFLPETGSTVLAQTAHSPANPRAPPIRFAV
jgi:hypothetical protein